MACRGCAQTGDCACAVIGDGTIITVSGTGGALDPYTIAFDMEEAVESLATATPTGSEVWTLVARRDSDGEARRIPASSCCSVML